MLFLLLSAILVTSSCDKGRNNKKNTDGTMATQDITIVSDVETFTEPYETTNKDTAVRIPYKGSFPTDIPTPFGYDTTELTEAYYFISDNEGWAACIDGKAAGSWIVTICHTTDKGNDWDRMEQHSDITFYPTRMFFCDENNGIIIGSLEDEYFYIYRTTDSGKTWEPFFKRLNSSSLNPSAKDFYGENSEILFPVNEYSSLEDIAKAYKSFEIKKINSNSAYVSFTYEKNGVIHENKVIYDKQGLRTAS